jgi:cation:H+ antiporter
VIVTLMAAVWLRLNAKAGGLAVWALLVNGLLYLGYLFVTLTR